MNYDPSPNRARRKAAAALSRKERGRYHNRPISGESNYFAFFFGLMVALERAFAR
jgi:hypothetical protein